MTCMGKDDWRMVYCCTFQTIAPTLTEMVEYRYFLVKCLCVHSPYDEICYVPWYLFSMHSKLSNLKTCILALPSMTSLLMYERFLFGLIVNSTFNSTLQLSMRKAMPSPLIRAHAWGKNMAHAYSQCTQVRQPLCYVFEEERVISKMDLCWWCMRLWMQR